MVLLEPIRLPSPAVISSGRAAAFEHAHALLSTLLELPLAVVDADSGDLLCGRDDQPSRDWLLRSEICREVARRGRPEVIEESDPVCVLALPLTDGQRQLVAVGAWLTRSADDADDLRRIGDLLGISPEAAQQWARRQRPRSVAALLPLADIAVRHLELTQQNTTLRQEVDQLSQRMVAVYEEISLLHRLAQNLRLSRSDQALGESAVEELVEVLPACGVGLLLLPRHSDQAANLSEQPKPVLVSRGRFPLTIEQIDLLLQRVRLKDTDCPFVANRNVTQLPNWPLSDIREVVLVPVSEGNNTLGWLLAVNHCGGGEFGTAEAQLLHSVATILGIHSGNIELYRRQAELVASVIRVLSSAIDAKDPYTCGHSDRVARVAVRLGQQLKLNEELLNTIYLSGLLHDIGKIGIDDAVLRKPGKLTPAEYEHIKTHVDIGYNILSDLKELAHLLPGVRFHHEAWDGSGYPCGLKGTDIPLLARVIAVADSFDAMSSDRPYRKGMDDEKLDSVLRRGAGQQWDADIVAAFFQARDDIRRISHREEEPGYDPEVPRWIDTAWRMQTESR